MILGSSVALGVGEHLSKKQKNSQYAFCVWIRGCILARQPQQGYLGSRLSRRRFCACTFLLFGLFNGRGPARAQHALIALRRAAAQLTTAGQSGLIGPWLEHCTLMDTTPHPSVASVAWPLVPVAARCNISALARRRHERATITPHGLTHGAYVH